MVHINDVPLVCLYDVPYKSQMKHPMTSLRYVSTTCQSYVITTSSVGLSYVSKLLCHDPHLVGFYVSKYQIKHQIFSSTKYEGN